jgi:hypothetical protein
VIGVDWRVALTRACRSAAPWALDDATLNTVENYLIVSDGDVGILGEAGATAQCN